MKLSKQQEYLGIRKKRWSTMKRAQMKNNSEKRLGVDFSPYRFLALIALFVVSLTVSAPAQGPDGQEAFAILGEIEHMFVDDPNDMWSQGTIVIGRTAILVPRNLLIDLPANRLTLSGLFADAPPDCLAANESGLASQDSCVPRGGAAHAAIAAVKLADGRVIAGDIFLTKGGSGELAGGIIPTSMGGYISHIDYDQGYIVVNGQMNQRPAADGGPADNPGIVIRWNDPEGVHTIQQGYGCAGGINCSPDVRFTCDPENYTLCTVNGYPQCIPSTNATLGARNDGADPVTGFGDEFCDMANRFDLTGGPDNRLVSDSRIFMPVRVGDNFGGEGNWEEPVPGERFFSMHSGGTLVQLYTQDNSNSPDYLTMAEVEWDCGPWSNDRIKCLFIGFSTLADSQVDGYALHIDPATGENPPAPLPGVTDNLIRYPLWTTVGNLDAINQGIPGQGAIAGGDGIFKVGYDVDFILGAPVIHSICQNLQNGGFIGLCPNGGTMLEEFDLLNPLSREAQVFSRHFLNPGNEPTNILGDPAAYGQYLTPIGVGHPEWDEIDLKRARTPMVFAAVPWTLDRRLGPGGCSDVCETLADAPIGSLGLDPFPWSGFASILSIPGLPDNAGPPALGAGIPLQHHPFGLFDSIPYPPLTAGSGTSFTDHFASAAPESDACSVPNNIPSALDDAATTDEDTSVALTDAGLISNDTDADDDTLSLYQIDGESTEGGLVTGDGFGNYSYTPPSNHNGTDTVGYRISDGHGGTGAAKVTITINPVNDAPTAGDDNLTVPAAAAFSFSAAGLLANDSDIDNDALTVVAVVGATTADGGATWDHPGLAAGLHLTDYSITDGSVLTPVLGKVTFHAGNNAPTAVDVAVATLEDTSVLVTGSASDPDVGDTLSISGSTDGAKGTVASAGGLTLTYSPGHNENGTDSFTYTVTDGKGAFSTATVTVEIAPVNDAPIAISDFAVTPEDIPIVINVLANDSDPEGDPLTISLTQDAAFFGILEIVDPIAGTIRFTPEPNISTGGPDNFPYIVSDGTAFTVGFVAVVVTPVNDAPVAAPDSFVTLEDTPVSGNLLLNDSDIENDALQIRSLAGQDAPVGVAPPFTTTVSGLTIQWAATGVVLITPDEDFNAPTGVTFNYTMWDGRLESSSSVLVIVISANDTPVALDDIGNTTLEDTPLEIDVLANDFDVDPDNLIIANVTAPNRGTATVTAAGTILYTPFADDNGPDTFGYTLSDGNGGSDSATVGVLIVAVNDDPVAGEIQAIPLAEDTVKLITAALILGSAVDVDGDELTIIAVTQPANGSVSMEFDGGGAVTGLLYTPAANTFGTDSFTYTISDGVVVDGELGIDEGEINLSILPVNDVPVANNDTASTDQGTALNIAPLSNDTDADGDVLSVATLLTGPSSGTAVINADQTVTYTPDPEFSGADSIVYSVSDGNGASDNATISITVIEVVAPAASVIRGDANIDGNLDVSDPILTMLFLFNEGTIGCQLALDSNDDEAVDLGDIIFTLNHVFSTGGQPGAPFPFCGVDPTEGGLPCEDFGLCE